MDICRGIFGDLIHRYLCNTVLDQDKINSNQAYIDEYQRILQEMEQQSERSINSLMNKFIFQMNYITSMGNGEGNRAIKFFTGAFWSLLITVCIPFMNTFKKRSDKLIAFTIIRETHI